MRTSSRWTVCRNGLRAAERNNTVRRGLPVYRKRRSVQHCPSRLICWAFFVLCVYVRVSGRNSPQRPPCATRGNAKCCLTSGWCTLQRASLFLVSATTTRRTKPSMTRGNHCFRMAGNTTQRGQYILAICCNDTPPRGRGRKTET